MTPHTLATWLAIADAVAGADDVLAAWLVTRWLREPWAVA